VPSRHERSNNMTAINIILGIVAAVLLLFILGRPYPPISNTQRICCTIAFVAVVALIIALNIGG